MNLKKIIQFISILIILILVVYIINSINIKDFFTTLQQINSFYYILAAFFILLSFSISVYRWKIILERLNAINSGKLINCFGFCAAGYLFGLIIPSRIGYYGKAVLIKKFDNSPLEKGISAVNVETLFDLYYLVFASVISLLILFLYYKNIKISSIESLIVVLVILFLTIGLIAYLNFKKIINLSFYPKERLNESEKLNFLRVAFENILSKINAVFSETSLVILNRNLLYQLSILTVLSQLIAVIGLYFIILAVGTNLSFIYIFAILQLSYVIGIISMIPGGFGSSDFTLLFFLQEGGLNINQAVNVVLLWRLTIIIPICIIGIIFIGLPKLQLFRERV